MAFFVDYTKRVDGAALRWDDFSGLVPATQFGIPVGGGPLGDGNPATGYAIPPATTLPGTAGVANVLIASLVLGSAPTATTPNDDPIPSGLAGHTWSMVVVASDIFLQDFPDALVDAGYSLTVGLASLDGFGGATFVGGTSYPLETSSPLLQITSLISDGITAEPLPALLVTQPHVDAVNAGELFPFVRIDGPDLDVDPLLLLADLVLYIGSDVEAAMVQAVVRQYPRDDGLGLSSAPRIHPPPKGRRIAGGYQ